MLFLHDGEKDERKIGGLEDIFFQKNQREAAVIDRCFASMQRSIKFFVRSFFLWKAQ